MKITIDNIDEFIRAGLMQGCMQFAWQKAEWDMLREFAMCLGWPPVEKSGDVYMGVQHFLIDDSDGMFWSLKEK